MLKWEYIKYISAKTLYLYRRISYGSEKREVFKNVARNNDIGIICLVCESDSCNDKV